MAKLLDLEFIKKWVNISDEELMQRLVKDAVGLQKEAEANKRAADIAERKSDLSYTMDMIKRFFRQYNYLSQYFSDEEIETAVKNNMGKRDITTEQWVHTMSEESPIGIFLRHERGKFTECRGSWSRERQEMGSVYLVANQYQNVNGADNVTKELLLSRCPWVAEYKVSNNDANALTPDDSYTTGGGMAFLFTLITCGIYSWYWAYRMGTKVDKFKNGGSHTILFVILQIFGLGIVNYCILQDTVNDYAED